jgi:hypothetical protein
VPSCAGDGEVGTNNCKMFQDKVKTEWLTKGALSPTLLTAEKGGLCLFLQQECCFYVNQSRVVKNKIRQLQEQLEKRRRELEDSWNPLGNNISRWFSWLMPILMPVFLALIFLSFFPCIIRTIQGFLLDRMSAIANQKFNQLYLQGYQPLQNLLENYCEGPIQDATGA